MAVSLISDLLPCVLVNGLIDLVLLSQINFVADDDNLHILRAILQSFNDPI
jgi:hypothetical protein